MTDNGTREREIERFRQLSRDEREVQIFTAARGAREGNLALHEKYGEVVGELVGLRGDVQRYAAAIELALGIGKKKPAKPPSIPPPRAPLPSLLEERDDDDTKVRRVKSAALERILSEREQSDAALAYVSRWGSRLKAAGAIVGALVVIAGAIVAIVAYAKAHWH